jgi:starch synthase (maltosyl-transferring)
LGRMDTADSEKWRSLAFQVRASVMTLFYLPDHGYLSDCLHGAPGDSAEQAIADDALRPNQLFTLTLETLTDKKIAGNVLMSCETLIVPGAIRSLADRRVTFAMPIRHHNVLLSDPHFPFMGKYVGDEDTHRKPAYHNGTAWTWPFPSFCEAWLKIYGENAREKVRSWLLSAINLMRAGCIGQLPEILDGEAPHLQRGCDAQAWGVSEWVRVWIMTRTSPPERSLSSSRRRKYEH